MITVSFQGRQLSPGQRLQLEAQARIKQFMSPVLDKQVQETIASLEAHKESGQAPHKEWSLVSDTRGTPSIAEYMGYVLC